MAYYNPYFHYIPYNPYFYYVPWVPRLPQPEPQKYHSLYSADPTWSTTFQDRVNWMYPFPTHQVVPPVVATDFEQTLKEIKEVQTSMNDKQQKIEEISKKREQKRKRNRVRNLRKKELRKEIKEAKRGRPFGQSWAREKAFSQNWID